ncbi:hypothetical protein [Rhodococcus sp. NPDC003348]
MPWLRTGDTAATHPRYLALFELEDVDAMTRIAAFGFVSLCATLAAQHTSDYLVTYGVAASVGHGAEPLLLDICVRAGLMEEVTVGGIRQWKITDDPEFLHMRSREEIEWERQRKTDNSNHELIVPVRLRDGDACRYCGQVVDWTARKGRLRGTYDHRNPGKAATVETMVVACQGCNAGRSNDPTADRRYPPLPAPSKPYFSPKTRDWIAQHDWARANGYTITTRRGRAIPRGTVPDDRKAIVEQYRAAAGTQPTDPTPAATQPPAGERAPQRPDTQPGNAHHNTHSDPTTSRGTRTTAATQQPAGERATAATEQPARERAPKYTPPPAQTPDLPDTADPAEAQSPASGSAGPGRDGSGRVGNPNPPGTQRDRDTPRSRRGRRRRPRT